MVSESVFETPYSGKGFNRLLTECIESTLKETLGETPTRALVYYLGGEDSVMGLEVFAERLEEVLGSGARAIKKAILERLCSRAEVEFQDLHYQEGKEFVDCVKAVKAILEQKQPPQQEER